METSHHISTETNDTKRLPINLYLRKSHNSWGHVAEPFEWYERKTILEGGGWCMKQCPQLVVGQLLFLSDT